MNVHLLAEAEAEIESARQYLNRHAPELGKRFLDELDAVLERIRERPTSFPKLETLPHEEPYRRALLRKFSYVVVFEVIKDDILIVAVAHSSRRPNYWLNRSR